MKIAALGDIHSNDIALEACLNRIEREHISTVLFMGDYVSDCARPGRTLALMRQCQNRFDCRFIIGNREQYMLTRRDGGYRDWRYGTGGGSLLYTYEHLTEEDFAFFESLPAVRTEDFEGLPRILRCHGTPEKLRGSCARHPDDAVRWMKEADAGLLLCAHTHHPCVMVLENGGLLVNTGCVGLAVNHPGEAEFAVLEGENGCWSAEIVTEPFDAEKVIRTFDEDGFREKSGLWADMMTRQLRVGGEGGTPMVKRAMALAAKQGIEGDIGDVPEEIWHRAAVDVGVLER